MRRTEKRYPLEPLAKVLDVELARSRMVERGTGKVSDEGRRFAEQIGIDPKRIPWLVSPRNANPGLGFYDADRAACMIGRLPWELWSDWDADEQPFAEPHAR